MICRPTAITEDSFLLVNLQIYGILTDRSSDSESVSKVLKTPTLAERQLRLTQTVTQSASEPYGQIGHVGLKNLRFWTESHKMGITEFVFRPGAISGPRGLGFESRYSDQKSGDHICGRRIFLSGFESKQTSDLLKANRYANCICFFLKV